jgi:hemerythrin superfamily protein
MSNGIDLVLTDHRDVEALFTSFDETGDASFIGLTIAALTAHDEAEHAALYPLLAVVVGDAGMIERASIAHSMIKKQIDVLGSLEGPPLVDAFRVLQGLVTEHVADEERNLLPALAASASDQQLEGLGARILQVKQRVG